MWVALEGHEAYLEEGYAVTENVRDGLIWLESSEKSEVAPLEKTAKPVSGENVVPVAENKSKG